MKKLKYLILVFVLCALFVVSFASCDIQIGSGASSSQSATQSSGDTVGSVTSGNGSDAESVLPDSSDITGEGGGVVDNSDTAPSDGTDESNDSADNSDTAPSGSTDESNSGTTESSGSDSSDETTDSSDTHKHVFDSWEIIKLPNCTEAGLQERACECGETEEKEIAPMGHSYGKWVETKSATCTEMGEEERKCYCSDVQTRQTDALGHDIKENGACTRCEYYFAEKAIILSIDISSSMKDILGKDNTHSRFTALIASLKATLEAIEPDTMVSIIAFDGRLHLICEPRFLGPKGERQAVISEIEYTLTHEYYRFYLDANGDETNIPVNQNDGTTYTSQGYIKPTLSVDERDGGYDRANGYWIKTYGTAYLPPITYASQAFDTINASEKSFIFVSDGEPMDRGSGYLEIIKELADKGIKTSTVCLGNDSTAQKEELTSISANGQGLFFTANTPDELTIALNNAFGVLESLKETDENGFKFIKINENYYLVGYVGDETDIVLPDNYKGWAYKLMAGSINGLQSIHSITFPAFITEIPSYTITNCKHLYTVKFLAESQVRVNANAFDGCVRIYETYGSYSGSFHSHPSVYSNNRHTYLDEESCVNTTAEGLVIGKTNNRFFEIIDYLGNEKELRVVIPTELIGSLPEHQVMRYVSHYAFYETSLEGITFEGGFNWIGSYAFANTQALKHIVFEGDTQITSLGQYAFSDCPSLEFIKIPDITSKSPTAFLNSPNVIVVCAGTEKAPISAPVVYNCTGFGYASSGFKWVTSSAFEGVMICGYIGNDEAITIPSQISGVNVTRISDGAFAGLDHITSIDIPDSVTSIGKDAFLGCTKLGNVKEGILYLDGWVISYTGDYTEVKIDSEAVGIASHAFYDRDDLITVIMPQSVKYLSKDAIIDCESITVCFECNQEQDTWTQGWNTNNVPVTFNYCAANGHIWNSATCTEPRICSLCGAPTGLPNGHTFENRYCTVCNAIEIFDVTYNEWSGTVWETAVPNEDGTHTLRTGRKSTSNYSGYTFFGWVDDAGNLYAPGETVYFERDTRLYEAYGKTVYTASELTSAITAWSHTFIRLGNDITVTSAISANATVVFIDLNGYTLTSTSSSEAFNIWRGSFALVGEGKFVHQPSSVNTGVSASSVIFYGHGYGDETYPQVFRIGKDVTFETPYNALRVNTVVLDATPDILIAGTVTAKALAYISTVTTNALCEIENTAKLNLSDAFITFANTTGEGNYMIIWIDGEIEVKYSGIYTEFMVDHTKIFVNGEEFIPTFYPVEPEI